MSIESVCKVKCELCQKVRDYESVDEFKQAGGVELSFDNPHLDRDWREVHVCGNCVDKILEKKGAHCR